MGVDHASSESWLSRARSRWARDSSVTIGDRALIGPGVMIIDSQFHDLYDRRKTPPALPITLEADVWIGAKASILPGVTIGRGAVVAAHALVNTDVAPFTVVGGVPARLITTLDPARFVDVTANATALPRA
jgi:acetyltransferase-like isoleucine patch superfamily enzyme